MLSICFAGFGIRQNSLVALFLGGRFGCCRYSEEQRLSVSDRMLILSGTTLSPSSGNITWREIRTVSFCTVEENLFGNRVTNSALFQVQQRETSQQLSPDNDKKLIRFEHQHQEKIVAVEPETRIIVDRQGGTLEDLKPGQSIRIVLPRESSKAILIEVT